MKTNAAATTRTGATRRLQRNVGIFLGCAVLGGALANAGPALAYARHISPWECIPLYSPLQISTNSTPHDQFGTNSYLGFYCPFTYDTTFLDSSVNTIRVDTMSAAGAGGAQVSACYVTFDGSSAGCSATVLTPATTGYGSASPSPTLWKQDPNKTAGSRYTFVTAWLNGGGSLNGINVAN